MELAADYRPEFESLRDLLLEIAPERSVESLLKKVVQQLAQRPHAVLAQLWLIDKGDLCPLCPMRPRCRDQSRCLHLVAGAESRVSELDEGDKGIERELRRIPLGVGVIGRIAASGEPMVSNDPESDLEELSGHDWITVHGIQGFSGQPLGHLSTRKKRCRPIFL